jgi:trans-2,3-dihydro-3-hydroxyanthranilate isomerase
MMMSGYSFTIADVFTDKKYTGNQLAVFKNAAGLSGGEMQSLAREINFSETTFILSDEKKDGGYNVRIFTPMEEVPFAGHPTLGTAYIIRNEIDPDMPDQVLLNLPVGQIPVTFNQDGTGWMKQIQPEFGQKHEPGSLAKVLGLDMADIDTRFPIQEVSTGLPFFIVPLKRITALKNAKIERNEYLELIKNTEAKGILIFCPETHEPQNNLSVRVFVDYFGVPEDPATGSGNGCLAGYLVNYRYFGGNEINIRSEQGYEISRPSLLLLRAARKGDNIDIFVGGKCVIVAHGELT